MTLRHALYENYFALVIDSKRTDEIKHKNWPIEYCDDPKQAVEILKNPTIPIGAVFLNPSLSDPGPFELMKVIKAYRPITPFYLLHENEPDISQSELSLVAANGSISKLFNSDEIVCLFKSDIFQVAKRIPDVDIEDPRYQSVPITDFLTGIISNFDIFVKLPSKKFLKICHAGDVLEATRVHVYVSKGASYLYLKSSSVEKCLSYCDSLVDYYLESPGFSQSFKTSQTFNQGDKIIAQIRQQGLEEIHFDYVFDYLKSLNGLMKEVMNHDVLAIVHSNIKAHEHAVSVTVVSALLCLSLKMESLTLFETVGVASFFHDVGLYTLPLELEHENPKNLSPDQMLLFESHPEKSVELLKEFPFIKESVLQAVRQHHQRRDGSGFPRVENPNVITFIAEIIGMADDIVHTLDTEIPNLTLKNYLALVMPRFEKKYTEPMIKAFKDVFLQ